MGRTCGIHGEDEKISQKLIQQFMKQYYFIVVEH